MLCGHRVAADICRKRFAIRITRKRCPKPWPTSTFHPPANNSPACGNSGITTSIAC